MNSMTKYACGIGTALLLITSIAPAASAQTKAEKEVASAMGKVKHVALADAIKSATASGKPISARYEFEDGKLKLSVFVEKEGFSELFFDHMNGKVAQVDKITAGDDIKDARAQSKAMAKATKSLADALSSALANNPGYIATEIVPVMEGKSPAAEITLMKDGKFKGVSEPLR